VDWFGQPGITWPLRGISFSGHIVPAGSAFSVAGKMAFVPPSDILAYLALFNSSSFDYLVRLFAGKVGGVQYEAGLIRNIAVPKLERGSWVELTHLARCAWSLYRTLDAISETSHAFLLPAALRPRVAEYSVSSISAELANIQSKIDEIAFALYGFDEVDRAAVFGLSKGDAKQADEADSDEDGDDDRR